MFLIAACAGCVWAKALFVYQCLHLSQQALNQVSQLGYRGFFNVKVAFVLSQIALLVRIV